MFAGRIGADLAAGLPQPGDRPCRTTAPTTLLDPSVRAELAPRHDRGRGRPAQRGLARGARRTRWRRSRAGTSDEPSPAAWEATGLHAVATALVRAAALREETRGAHWREDHPDADDGLARPPRHHPHRHDRRRGAARVTLSAPTLAALAAARARPGRTSRTSPGAPSPRTSPAASTSRASRRCPAAARGVAAFVPAARRGCVAGIAVAMAVLDVRRRVTPDRRPTAATVPAGRAGAASRRRPVRDPAHRRAQRPQPALPPVRRRDADPALGRRRRGHRRARSATPARPRPGLRALEKYAVRAAAGRTTGWALSDAALVKDNHVRRGRRRRRGLRGGPRGASRGSRSRSSATP